MATTTPVTPPEQLEIEAARSPIAEVTTYLQEHLGQRLTAYLSGLKDAKTVGQWAAGKVTPRDAASLRLRHAFQAVRLLVEAFGDETAKAWMFGMNSQLDDEAPGYVLRHAELPEEISPVVRTARSFVESGFGSRGMTESHQERHHLVKGLRSQLARVLASEVERQQGEPMEVAEPVELSQLRNELLEAPGSLDERIVTLELAQAELEKKLTTLIQLLKGDLAHKSQEATR